MAGKESFGAHFLNSFESFLKKQSVSGCLCEADKIRRMRLDEIE